MINLGETICALLEDSVDGVAACFEFCRRSEFFSGETQRDVAAADDIDGIDRRSPESPNPTLFERLLALPDHGRWYGQLSQGDYAENQNL